MLLRRRGHPLTVTTVTTPLSSSSSSSSPVVSDNDDYEQQQRGDNGTDVPLLQRSPLSIDESDDNDDDSLSPGSPSKQTRQRRKGFRYPRRRGSLLVVFVVVIFCGGYRQLYHTKQEFGKSKSSSDDDGPPDRRYRNPNLVTDKAGHHQQHHLSSITRDEHPQPPSDRRPRIVCIDDDSEYCQSLHRHYRQPQGRHEHKKKRKVVESHARANSKTEPNSHDRSPADYIHMIDNEDCTFSDPSYQAVPMAPSTCNDVHSLSFILPTIGSRSNDQEKSSSGGGGGGGRDGITSRYLARGGYRDVWALTQPLNDNHRHNNNDDDDDTDDTEYDNGKSIAIAAMKTNRLDKHDWWSIFILEKYRRDALISERAGGLESSTSNGNSNHHVVPLYHYCAFSSIVPYSTSGPLDLYVHGRVHDKYNIRKGIMDPIEMYILAMQAARGVYQAHLYNNGYATNAIADIKPPQFLLFTRQEHERQRQKQEKIFDMGKEDYSDNNNDYNDDDDDDALTMDRTTKTTTQRAMEEYINIPIVQLQDFNRGRYLGRNRTTPYKTCGFQICNIDNFWNFRSPEEYSGLTSNGNENCMYQDDKIDTWALGAVFYFLLSDGRIPFYYIMDNDHHHSRKKNNSNNNDFTVVMKMILDGITSKLPEELLSLSDDEEEEDVMIMNDMKRILNLSLKARSKHPAYVALKDVMLACWEYNPEVRPSSLKVVQMLEEMWDKVNIKKYYGERE